MAAVQGIVKRECQERMKVEMEIVSFTAMILKSIKKELNKKCMNKNSMSGNVNLIHIPICAVFQA